MGKILAECKWDVDDVIYCFEYYAGKAVELDAKQGVAVPLPDAEYACELRYDACGVCGFKPSCGRLAGPGFVILPFSASVRSK